MKKYKIGVVCSSFDLMHPGHIKILECAKGMCDKVIVALNCNPQKGNPNKNSPIETVYERWKMVSACRYVDEIIPYEDDADLLTLLNMTTYDVRILGADYEGRDHVGKCEEAIRGISIEYVDRSHKLSTTSLRARVVERELLKKD